MQSNRPSADQRRIRIGTAAYVYPTALYHRCLVRTFLSILLIALVLTACSAPGIGTTTPPAPTSFDLTDQDLLARLGSPPFEDIGWKRTLHGITVVGSSAHPDPDELALLDAALGDLPSALLDVATPRMIIRVPSAPEEEKVGNAIAFAKGPDVYLVDRTFRPNGEETTRLDLTRALGHELAHVAQFRTLSPDYIEAALDGTIDRVDPVDGSVLVREFATVTGWTNTSDDPNLAAWTLPADKVASTAYGRTSPAEDMAETVAMLVSGWSPPADHAAWATGWLQANADTLAHGEPYIPAGAVEIRSSQPIYDVDAVADIAPGADRVEAHYYELATDSERHDVLAPSIERRLLRRGLSGALTRASDDRLPRYAGTFTRPDGLRYRVELWDFREGNGFSSAPDAPILTYVVVW